MLLKLNCSAALKGGSDGDRDRDRQDDSEDEDEPDGEDELERPALRLVENVWGESSGSGDFEELDDEDELAK